MHWENYISISFHIDRDIIVVTVFLSILNQMEIHLVQNRKEICHHDHIPFNMKWNRNIVLSVLWACRVGDDSAIYTSTFVTSKWGAELEKNTSSVRETHTSRHNVGQFEGPKETFQYYSAVMFEVFLVNLNWAPWCRDTLVSKKVVRLIIVVFSVWKWHVLKFHTEYMLRTPSQL